MQEKRAVAGLWSVPGIGPKTVATLKQRFDLEDLADTLIAEWVRQADLPSYAAERIPHGCTLGELGDQLLEAAGEHHMRLAWLGEKEYPERLAEISNAPPLLFYRGPGTDAPPRRRVAMVGTRHPDSLCIRPLTRIIEEVAAEQIGVVSGAAQGIDSLAHRVAAHCRTETWAFVGSSLDHLDPLQRSLWEELAPLGATFWSELPPGVRAERKTFPRRNRLISGASDAVAVLRAGVPSGTQHTVDYAVEQGRPVLAVPGEINVDQAQLCIDLLRQGAFPLADAGDIMRAIGVSGYESQRPAPVETKRVDVTTLSAAAQQAFAAIDRRGKCYDDLLIELQMKSGQLIAAIFELTMSGLVVEHAGRRYEKI